MEYLCGYIDGATTFQWNKLKIFNGMPEKYHTAWRYEVVPLNKQSLEELIEKSTLSISPILLKSALNL